METRSDTGTLASYDLIMSWLSNCTTNHRACDKAILEVTYLVFPQRSIVVTGRLRLVELEFIPDDKTYAALSHCWGSSPGLTTTRDTVRAFKRSIDPEVPPRTFLDAIELTHKPRSEYLWIDALCILQDSEEDSEAESAMMGYYYRNVHLIIPALDAADEIRGFLHTTQATLGARIDDTELWREAGLSLGRYVSPITTHLTRMGPTRKTFVSKGVAFRQGRTSLGVYGVLSARKDCRVLQGRWW
jgi:hypothetical protein